MRVKFFNNKMSDTVAVSTSHGPGMNLSHLVSVLSFQKTFSNLRHVHVTERSSTAPLNFSEMGPRFPPVVGSAAGEPPATAASTPTVSV